MSKKITPCEKLGYKVGDRLKVLKSGAWFRVGEEVELGKDDGSNHPYFFNERMAKDSDGGWPLHVESVEKISNAKLKPAKQALADAIHQNGGWPIEVHWLFATSSHVGAVSFWVCRPKFNVTDWFEGGARCVTILLNRGLPNWHQCILSRDEYFTAYPGQVKVEVKNETEQKVEAEMKSKSEMTIKVSDWHENGELPPVGVFCDARVTLENTWLEIEVVAHRDGFVLGWRAGQKRGYSGDDKSNFRPLRTERDKAIDEMVGECIDHYGDPKGGERYLGIAAKLYDAGYRKEVK